jgi:large subunit ribosomal protein L18e
MKSKTLIDRQASRKLNPELVESIIAAKKNEAWLPVAVLLSYPKRKQINKNLDEIDKISKEGDTIIVPGKVLANGNVSKKIRIAAIAFSGQAKEKLKSKKCEIVSIKEEIKINPKAQGLNVLK